MPSLQDQMDKTEPAKAEPLHAEAVSAALSGKPILVTTRTCPNCAAAKNALNAAGVEYTTVLADEEDGAEIAARYDVTAAPTLIVGDGEDAKIYRTVGGIHSFLKARMK